MLTTYPSWLYDAKTILGLEYALDVTHVQWTANNINNISNAITIMLLMLIPKLSTSLGFSSFLSFLVLPTCKVNTICFDICQLMDIQSILTSFFFLLTNCLYLSSLHLKNVWMVNSDWLSANVFKQNWKNKTTDWHTDRQTELKCIDVQWYTVFIVLMNSIYGTFVLYFELQMVYSI